MFDLLPRTPFIIASNATKFQEKFGVPPDFENGSGQVFGMCAFNPGGGGVEMV